MPNVDGKFIPTKLTHEEFKKAAAPLIDILYKYGCPHSYIIVTQTDAELLNGEIAVVFEPRD